MSGILIACKELHWALKERLGTLSKNIFYLNPPKKKVVKVVTTKPGSKIGFVPKFGRGVEGPIGTKSKLSASFQTSTLNMLSSPE